MIEYDEFEVDGIKYLDPRSAYSPIAYNPVRIQWFLSFKDEEKDAGAPMIWWGSKDTPNIMQSEIDYEYTESFMKHGYVY